MQVFQIKLTSVLLLIGVLFALCAVASSLDGRSNTVVVLDCIAGAFAFLAIRLKITEHYMSKHFNIDNPESMSEEELMDVLKKMEDEEKNNGGSLGPRFHIIKKSSVTNKKSPDKESNNVESTLSTDDGRPEGNDNTDN